MCTDFKRHTPQTRAAHTPGPWEVNKPIHFMTASITAPGPRGKLFIAHVDNVDGFLGSSEANARLLATAPDLYIALKEIYRAFGQHNLFSTATEEERRAALERVMDAYNKYGYPALSKVEGIEP